MSVAPSSASGCSITSSGAMMAGRPDHGPMTSGKRRRRMNDATVIPVPDVFNVVARRVNGVVAVATALATASCVRSTGPVQTFEAFYAAAAARDVLAVRASLCPQERRLLAHVDDDTLLTAMDTRKVLRSVTLVEATNAAAIVDVADALGNHQHFQLRHDLQAVTGWCVAGPISAPVDP